MKKLILLAALALGFITNSSAQMIRSHVTTRSYSTGPEKKKEWKFRLGMSASNFVGKDVEDADLNSHIGYQLGFEYRRFMKTGMFWGMEFNFASRGNTAEIDSDEGHWDYNRNEWISDGTIDTRLTFHEFEWVPINLGYKYNINQDIAVSTRIGAFVNVAMVGNYKYGDEDAVDAFDDDSDYSRFNAGIKWGIGAQWKHLALDFEVQKSFVKSIEDVKAYERAFNLTVGYIF